MFREDAFNFIIEKLLVNNDSEIQFHLTEIKLYLSEIILQMSEIELQEFEIKFYLSEKD